MEGTRTTTGSIMTQAIIEFLVLNIPILGRLKDNELKTIVKYMNLVEVIPGEIVFEEGDRRDYVCFVVDGTLDVLRKSETGESIVISTLSKGRSIGEMAVIDELPRSATVKARTKSTLITLSQENFNYMLAEHSSIGVKILKGIARLLSMNLRKTSTSLADYMLPLFHSRPGLSRHPVSSRTAKSLPQGMAMASPLSTRIFCNGQLPCIIPEYPGLIPATHLGLGEIPHWPHSLFGSIP